MFRCLRFSLEEYLQELAGIHPQQLQKIAERAAENSDEAKCDDEVPNFAHAALILQNSSNVYSRKVEYLYSLVYKALEDFARDGLGDLHRRDWLSLRSRGVSPFPDVADRVRGSTTFSSSDTCASAPTMASETTIGPCNGSC